MGDYVDNDFDRLLDALEELQIELAELDERFDRELSEIDRKYALKVNRLEGMFLKNLYHERKSYAPYPRRRQGRMFL